MSRLRWLCSLMLLILTGCQSLQVSQGPVVDTLRAMLERPVGIELTKAQLQDFPYASQYFSYGEGAQALIVLSHFSGARSVYSSREGNALLLAQGRAVESLGFATNFKFLQDLPLPTIVLERNEPVCWSSLWRASGQRIANNYRLSGCLHKGPIEPVVMPEGVVNLQRVNERVSVSQVGLVYENSYWVFPGSNQVVASRQYGGPKMPLMTFRRVINEPLLPEVPASVLLQKAPPTLELGTILVEYVGVQSGFSSRAPKSNDVVMPFLHVTNIDWDASRLYCLDQQVELSQQRDALVADLDALAKLWQARKQRALSISALALAKEIQTWRMAKSITAELNPSALKISSEKSLSLKGSRYLLVLVEPQLTTPVFGTVFSHDLRWQGSQALARLEGSRYLMSGANTDYVWLLNRNRKVQKVDVKKWSSQPLEWEAGSQIVVGFNSDLLPPAWSNLNERILALALNRIHL